MTPTPAPLIEIAGLSKDVGEPGPLRVRRLTVHAGDRLAISGLTAAAAETLINLITGASVPDEGTVRVAGRDTRDIATDTDWLQSLDRFGIVTHRAVLIGALTIADNLALPLTLSIDPISAETRAAVEVLAHRAGLSPERLGEKASTLTAGELVRVHLARALASEPALLLLEHPTGAVRDRALQDALGRTLADATAASGTGWLALSDDLVFLRAARAVRWTIDAEGTLRRSSFWSRIVR
jgi:predicted ABC-type transport system involved in lysophospholipase L1 biosynthesis ATPase subunit